MGSELKMIIDQVSREKGLDRDILIAALEEAIKSAVKKRYGACLDLEVNFNNVQGEIEVFQYRTVVEEVHDQETEISMEEAKELDSKCELEDCIGTKMDISALGRIAAQSARQFIIQKMKAAERDLIYKEFKDRKGEIVNGIIQRYERGNIIINLGRTEAILPTFEQISSESYRRGDRLRAYIIEVKDTQREPQIVLSRTHPDFLIKLFELEVPEISEGIVQIMGVSREPGSRSKIAVSSSESDVDPVGACVGMRGSRVQAMVQELRGEKIDIVPWSPDPAKYVYNALAPAECSRVIVDDSNQSLEVIVPDDQLSLAIGRQGQNVRLASKLMGWRIDVKSETRYQHYQDPDYYSLLEISTITENIADKIYDLGVTSLELLAQADPDELSQETNLSTELISSLVEEAKNLMKKGSEKEEALSEEIDINKEAGNEKEDLLETEEKVENHESQMGSAQDVPDKLHEDSRE
ncbi:MAG: transcription termination factor NusA [Deltaproteobacteria bacterium]|nr:transcription termination factor NusA [Deltaproteobacteria bacterium]MDL1961135.1 transcription termination factor NusA [Deltaproteobacteria bacterium]